MTRQSFTTPGRAPGIGVTLAIALAVSFVPNQTSAQDLTDDNWVALGGGEVPGNSVYATTIDGAGNLYVGGAFDVIGPDAVPAAQVAKWDGTTWSALGDGLTGEPTRPIVWALATSGPYLYAGGTFLRAGGEDIWRLAKWDGASWSAVGESRLRGNVHSLLAHGYDLYVGGAFNRIARLIAKWDGTGWSPLGDGLNGIPYAMLMMGTNLVVAGEFSTAGSIEANNIAVWNGANWTTLGDGVNGRVNALAVVGTDLYAGGWFTWAGGELVNYIARWDGESWTQVKTQRVIGTDGHVYSLGVLGGQLYAGGTFAKAGGVTVNTFGRWDGETWHPVGSGLDNVAFSLLPARGGLYVGGNFTRAGDKESAYIARLALPGRPNIRFSGDEVIIHFDVGPGNYRISRAARLNEWTGLATQAALEVGGLEFTDEDPPYPNAFYKAERIETP